VTPAPQELLSTDDLLADASTTNEEEDRVADAAPAANGLSFAFVDYVTHETFKVVKLVEKTNEKGSPSTPDSERVQPSFGVPPPPCGNQRMGFGKYCGRTYAQVYADDLGYCRWALRVRKPERKLYDFVHYLKAQNDDVIGCDRPMGFGKYRRQTYGDVVTNDHDYCAWALRQHCRCEGLEDFIQYLNDQEVDCARAGIKMCSALQ
jgi:uncharacterized protein (DUF3820 family)